MGYNTSVIVLNDALSNIEQDGDFGKNLARAIDVSASYDQYRRKDVSAKGFVNAASVIETHHADYTRLVAFGGNHATALGSGHRCPHHTPEGQEEILRRLADELGFRLVKNTKRS